MLVLRRASDATRQENPVRAMILGAATGQDGHGNGIAAPNAPAQLAVIERALKQAAVSAGAIAHVECHATGTRLGDAIEMEAIAQAYGAAAERGRPVVVAALKPLLGHLEAASGMAALVKVFLAREAGRLPHARPPRTLNAEIAALEANLGFSSTAGAWPADTPFAAISAFGMSGTNAHVIVGPPPAGGAARRPRPSYPAFRRQRFWPGFIAERRRATEAAAIRSSHAECFGVEWQVIPDAGRTVSDPVILAGSGAMSERLAAVLRAGGISFRSLETGEPVPQGAIQCSTKVPWKN